MRILCSKAPLFAVLALMLVDAHHFRAFAQSVAGPMVREVAAKQTADRPTSPQAKEIIAKELLTWDLEKRKDKKRYAALMAPNFVAITDRGVMNTALNLQEIDDLDFETYSATDFKVRFLTKEAALLTYKVAWKARSQDKKYEENDYAAAIWAKHGDKWLDEYYQETLIPVPSSSQASTTEHSDVGSPASTGSTDDGFPESEDALAKNMVAKEKLSWSLAARKNKPSYAALLGADFSSVSENGAQDKSENVSDLDNLTIDRHTFADFNIHMIGKQLVLLTYRVAASGSYKGKSYASSNYAGSVWAKRGSEWLNVFFQETGVNASKP